MLPHTSRVCCDVSQSLISSTPRNRYAVSTRTFSHLEIAIILRRSCRSGRHNHSLIILKTVQERAYLKRPTHSINSQSSNTSNGSSMSNCSSSSSTRGRSSCNISTGVLLQQVLSMNTINTKVVGPWWRHSWWWWSSKTDSKSTHDTSERNLIEQWHVRTTYSTVLVLVLSTTTSSSTF